MGRVLRISGPGAIHHIVSRCNNEEFLFLSDEDFRIYLKIIARYKKEFDFKLFHYTLMHNHTHLQVEVGDKGSISEIVQRINGEYAKWYNNEHKRKGHFWQGRFWSTLIKDEHYFLRCAIYIELNPLRAGLVSQPQQWKYSSICVYSKGKNNKLVDISPVYLSLGRDTKTRIKEYNQIFITDLERNNAIQRALKKEDRAEIRRLLRINSSEPIPFKRRIIKLFKRSINEILYP